MPATGTPEPDGLTWPEALKILRTLTANAEVIGMDCVELAPAPALHMADFAVAKLVYKAISYVMYKGNDGKCQCGAGVHQAPLSPLPARRRSSTPPGNVRFIDQGGRMLVALAGHEHSRAGPVARRDDSPGQVHAISCTGANLEDIYNLVAHEYYVRVPNYRDLTPEDEHELLSRHLNRVTDTCIPEEEAIRRIEDAILEQWLEADRAGERYFPHEFLYRILRSGKLEQYYQIDPKNSWMLAACEKNLPIFVPGWEDSTTGNIFAATASPATSAMYTRAHGDPEYMMELAAWYGAATDETPIGFFQIGGGIAATSPSVSCR